MLKARGKLISLLTACMALVLMLVMGIANLSIQPKVASAADTNIVFALGANGSASHGDGTSKTTYTETVNGYTLTLSNVSNFYTGARDAKGNSCIKLGASSKAGGFSFTVPADVTSVIIEVGKYKSNTTKVTIAGTTHTLTKNSNDGAYDPITVDTTSNKTVIVTTVSGGYRAMVNTITFVIPAPESGCEHANTTTTTTKKVTCTEDGSETINCNDCDYVETKTIPATGHKYNDVENGIIEEPTCVKVGKKRVECENCGDVKEEDIPMTKHTYVAGVCSGCGEFVPEESTLTFDNKAKRTNFSAEQQVWEENNIILTNNKESSTNPVADYAAPARFYQNSSIIIEYVGNIAKIVFNCNTSGYATALKTSIGATATVEDKVVTILLDGSSNTYTIAKLTAQVRMDSLTVILAKGCEHINSTTKTVVEATCTENGSITVTCDDCDALLSSENIPATGHTFVDKICSNCGQEKPEGSTITFDDKVKRTEYSTSIQVWEENGIKVTNNKDKSSTNVGDYANPVRFYKSSQLIVECSGMIKIVFNCDTAAYATALQESIGDLATADGKVVTVVLEETANSFTITLSAAVWIDSITAYKEESAKIEGASVTLKEDVSLNYYVNMGDNYLGAVMYFTMNGETYDVEGKEVDGRYQYSFDLPPQYMADTIQAVLKFNDTELGRIENYSVQMYVQNQLNKLLESPDENLKQVLTDMLYYGAAAQNYKGYNTENLATAGVSNLGTPSTATPETTDFTLVNNEGVDVYPAYFKSAGVHFAEVNSIYVKLIAEDMEKVTLTINGEEVEVNDTTVRTDGILATQFATIYTFVLYYNGEEMQTLTYSVNAYAYAKKDSATMGELALALYRYGASAAAYNS